MNLDFFLWKVRITFKGRRYLLVRVFVTQKLEIRICLKRRVQTWQERGGGRGGGSKSKSSDKIYLLPWTENCSEMQLEGSYFFIFTSPIFRPRQIRSNKIGGVLSLANCSSKYWQPFAAIKVKSFRLCRELYFVVLNIQIFVFRNVNVGNVDRINSK